MAVKLVADNIVVSAIAPGAFASDMNRAARHHGDEEATQAQTVYPMRCRIGKAHLSQVLRQSLGPGSYFTPHKSWRHARLDASAAA